jgi:hypothetical protein
MLNHAYLDNKLNNAKSSFLLYRCDIAKTFALYSFHSLLLSCDITSLYHPLDNCDMAQMLRAILAHYPYLLSLLENRFFGNESKELTPMAYPALGPYPKLGKNIYFDVGLA